jgi:twitching motility protein PilJ
MSVVNQFGKLFNRKPEESDTGLGADVIGGGQNVLTTGSIEGNTMRESYQTDAMNSVQGDPDGVSSELSTTDADEDLISLPLLGSNTAAGHQRNLLALLAIGVVLLALIAGWVLRQADRSAQQLAATGQSLMQSQRLAKSVSQALVGSPQAFPDVVESSGVLARNVRALNSGDSELGVESLGEQFKSDLEGTTPLMESAERNAGVVMGQQKILMQVGDALRTINRQSSDLLEIAETVFSLKLQQNAPAAEISAAGQLVMLTQRIGKSANEFQTMEGVSPEAVFLLGKDLNSFKEIAQGLLDGSPELRLTATKDAQTREQLEALIKLYEETRTQASAILGNLQGLVSAREAQSSIISDSEPLRRQLEGLQDKLSSQTGLGAGQFAALALAGLFVLLCGIGISRVQLLDSRGRQAAAEEQKQQSAGSRKPSARSRKPSASMTPIRQPFCV